MYHPNMIRRVIYAFLFVFVGNVFIGDIFDGLGLRDLCLCDALTSDGYADNVTGKWTPKACSLHHYERHEIKACMEMKQADGDPLFLVAIGDSRIRQFFAEFVNYIEPSLDVPYTGHYSRNRSIKSLGAYFEFNWLPLLSSVTGDVMNRVTRQNPSLIIFGHGPHDIAFTDGTSFHKEMRRLAPYLDKMAESSPVLWRISYRAVVPTNYSLTIDAFDKFISICQEHLPDTVLQWWSSKYHLDRSINLFKDPIHAGKRLDAADSQILYNFYCNDVTENLSSMTCFTSSCVFIKRLGLLLVFGLLLYVISYFLLPRCQRNPEVSNSRNTNMKYHL